MRRAALGLMLLAGPAGAQQFLYEPPPPRGAAQVRFVNALAEAVELRPSFARPLRLGTDPAARSAATPWSPPSQARPPR